MSEITLLESRNMTRMSFFLCLCTLIISCTTIKDFHQSVPCGPNVIVKGSETRILVSPELEITVGAYNSVISNERTYLLGIPIPSPGGEAIKPKFSMYIGFLTAEAGFSINLTNIILSISEKTGIRPVGYRFLPPQEGKEYSRQLAKEGRVNCGPWYSNYEYEKITHTRIDLPEKGIWNCYRLEFDIPPPHPKKKVALAIEGLEKNGKPYPISAICFEEKQFHETELVP